MRSAFLYLLLLLSFCTYGQSNPMIKYVGVINVEGVGAFPYQVNLQIDGAKISGHTITTTGAGIETKASLTGELRDNGKQIIFAENKIILTDVKDKTTTFCFVNAKLTKKNRGKLETLEGSFVGKNEKNVQCANGSIYLARKSAIMADTADIGQVLKKLGDTIKKLKKEEPIVIPLSLTEVNKIVGAGKKIQVRFYDGNKEDNDEISIAYNGVNITQKYVLTKNGKTVDFTIDKDKPNLIEITTLNLGTVGMNTVTIDVVVAPGKIKTYSFDAPAQKTIKIQLSNY